MTVRKHNRRLTNSGAVLFEVVLALVLFTFSVTIISSSFSASMRSVDRMRMELDEANLAISTLAEIELGLKPMESAPLTEFEPPFEKWSWQVEVTEPSEDLDMGGGLSLVEVIIQSEEFGRETRLARMIRGQSPPLLTGE
ncbi:MAG: hypothetical protein CMO63_06820 [Verrucomicrobiales bacterium]|nr:hypothetical protein [Verrucomicrobiales bacterium]